MSSLSYSSFLFSFTILTLSFSREESRNNSENDSNTSSFPHSVFNEEIPELTRLSIINLANNQNCSSVSPVNKIKYGFTTIIDTTEADFCNEYARRSCCSFENLNTLKSIFKKQMNNVVEMNFQCQKGLQQLICYDCDADIGQGFRKGVCSHECKQLYEVCKEDFFVVEEKITTRLRICNKNDILCSKLKDILSEDNASTFCQLLGYEINDNDDYDEWFSQFIEETVIQSSFEPVCWNFFPSGFFLGHALPNYPPPPPPPKVEKPKNYKENTFDPNNKLKPFDKLNKKYEMEVNILYGIIAFVLLATSIYCCCAFCCKNTKDMDSFHYD